MAPRPTKRNYQIQVVNLCRHNVVVQPQRNDSKTAHAKTRQQVEKKKPTIPTTTQQTRIQQNQNGTGAHDRSRRKSPLPSIGASHERNQKQTKTTIWFRRGSKQDTPTQRLLYTRHHAYLVLFLQTISSSIPRLYTTKTTSKKPPITTWIGIKVYPNTSSHKHMDKTKTNIHAPISTRHPLTLPFRRRIYHFR